MYPAQTSMINLSACEWVNTQYSFGIPACVLVIDDRKVFEILRKYAPKDKNLPNDPQDIAKILYEYIVSVRSVLIGCVVLSFELNHMKRQWEVYILHNLLKPNDNAGIQCPVVRLETMREGEQFIEGQIRPELPLLEGTVELQWTNVTDSSRKIGNDLRVHDNTVVGFINCPNKTTLSKSDWIDEWPNDKPNIIEPPEPNTE